MRSTARRPVDGGKLWAGCAAAFLACGCSAFERDWEAAGKAPEQPRAGAIEGRWEGGWKSEASGHEGGLRCLLTRSAEGKLEARYRATYACCFSFEYTVPMETVQDSDAVRFRGSADLGWFAGGVYEYEGSVQGNRFLSTYSSSGDHGTFDLTRVLAPPEEAGTAQAASP